MEGLVNTLITRLSICALVIFSYTEIRATPELSSEFYTSENIDIKVIIRYNDEIRSLYYSSMIKNLNDYISKQKAKGKFKRGKFHLEIMEAIWMDHATGVKMNRYRTGYYCFINALVQPITQEYLLKVIEYYNYANWESFCYDEEKVSPELALKIFNTKIDTIAVNANFPDRTVLKLNWVNIVLHNDDLVAQSGSTDLGIIEDFLPLKNAKADCYKSHSEICIIQDGKVLSRFDMKNRHEFSITEYSRAEAFAGWINFKTRGDYFLSYSCSKNMFYDLVKPKTPSPK